MKRCPQCRRDYHDDTLVYCLDDGSTLLDGPAVPTGDMVDEPATAILSEPSALAAGYAGSPGESRTRAQLNTTDRTAVLPTGIGSVSAKGRGAIDKRLIAAAAIAVVAIAGFLGYRYLAQSKQIDSIAVMPFVNESGQPDTEYLSDGMAESLMSSLAQLPGLNVKSRSSVFRYKGKDTDVITIGKELGVQAVLNGRIVQRGDGITLYLELVDALNGNRIWGGQYDRKTSDLIALQSDIARDVSEKLKTKLSGSDQQKLKKNYTDNVDAYQAYLKGRYHVFKLVSPEVQKSIEYFQKAIEIDPSYALAYAGLSDAYRSLALAGESDPNETLPKAKAAANKAIELDDELAEAHTALGVCFFWYDWNWDGAETQFKRALELNPNSSLAHLFYAHLLSNTGRHTEALSEVKRARELEPLAPFVSALEGLFLMDAGRTDESLERLKQAEELDPNFYFPHHFAASAYADKGMFAEAAAEGRRATELGPHQTVGATYEAYALAKMGKRDEALAILDQLLKLSEQRFVPPFHIALVYQGLGDTGKAIEWLEKGYEKRDPKMAFLKVERKWDSLRSDPRFAALIAKMAFPDRGDK
jgi:serine/threonine-protein kinase